MAFSFFYALTRLANYGSWRKFKEQLSKSYQPKIKLDFFATHVKFQTLDLM